MSRVVIGLGSNVGDRLAHLRDAFECVRAFAPNARASSIYETTPIGGPPQDDYLNMALAFDWNGEVDALHDLLGRLQTIEQELGRVRVDGQRWGPRTIDLDVLWVDGVVIATERLAVPHPRLRERAFALLPLVELVPDARDARTGEPFGEGPMPEQGLRRLELEL